MKPYNSISRNLIEIDNKIYKIIRYLGVVWLIQECNTTQFYIFDRSEEHPFLIRKKSRISTFVLWDLIAAGFVVESAYSFKGHLFKLLRCQANQCLYIADLELEEVRYLARVPCDVAEILLHPETGIIMGVFYEALNVIHIEGGKFVQ